MTPTEHELLILNNINQKINVVLEIPRIEWSIGDYRTLLNYHKLGSYSYEYYKDVDKFISCHALCPEMALGVYELNGRKSDRLYFGPTIISHVYYGLAGRNFPAAQALARAMIDSEAWSFPGLIPTSYYYNNVLLYLLVEDRKNFDLWYRKLSTKKQKSNGKAALQIYTGLLEKDVSLAGEGVKRLGKYTTRYGEDASGTVVSCEAIGLANVCRLQGLWVPASSEVPEELLITREECERLGPLFE